MWYLANILYTVLTLTEVSCIILYNSSICAFELSGFDSAIFRILIKSGFVNYLGRPVGDPRSDFPVFKYWDQIDYIVVHGLLIISITISLLILCSHSHYTIAFIIVFLTSVVFQWVPGISFVFRGSGNIMLQISRQNKKILFFISDLKW